MVSRIEIRYEGVNLKETTPLLETPNLSIYIGGFIRTVIFDNNIFSRSIFESFGTIIIEHGLVDGYVFPEVKIKFPIRLYEHVTYAKLD